MSKVAIGTINIGELNIYHGDDAYQGEPHYPEPAADEVDEDNALEENPFNIVSFETITPSVSEVSSRVTEMELPFSTREYNLVMNLTPFETRQALINAAIQKESDANLLFDIDRLA